VLIENDSFPGELIDSGDRDQAVRWIGNVDNVKSLRQPYVGREDYDCERGVRVLQKITQCSVTKKQVREPINRDAVDLLPGRPSAEFGADDRYYVSAARQGQCLLADSRVSLVAAILQDHENSIALPGHELGCNAVFVMATADLADYESAVLE
jgi:hypothetical protein